MGERGLDSGRVVGWDPDGGIVMLDVVESDRSEASLADNYGRSFFLREAPVYRLDDKVLFISADDDEAEFAITIDGGEISISVPKFHVDANWPLDADYTNVMLLDEVTGEFVATARIDTTATQASFDAAAGGGPRVIIATAMTQNSGWQETTDLSTELSGLKIVLAEAFDQVADMDTVGAVTVDPETGARRVEVMIAASNAVNIQFSAEGGTPRFAQVIAVAGSDTILGRVEDVAGNETDGYTLTVVLGQTVDVPVAGQVRLTSADRIAAFMLGDSGTAMVTAAQQHYTAKVQMSDLEWEVETRTQEIVLQGHVTIAAGSQLTSNGLVATAIGTGVQSGAGITAITTVTVELRRDGDVFADVADLRIVRADDALGQNRWAVDGAAVQIFETVTGAAGWPADNRQTNDWSVEVGSNVNRDVFAVEVSYTPYSDGDASTPDEASVLALLAADPLAELTPREVLIYEGIVQPLRPIVNDRFEFNDLQIGDRILQPDQATVLDVQDLGDANDPYRFRVFVEVTWQDLQDPEIFDGILITVGGADHALASVGDVVVDTPEAIEFADFIARRGAGLELSNPKEFFADQSFVLKDSSNTQAQASGRVTDWNGDLQIITLAGLTSGETGDAALNTTLLGLVQNGDRLSSEINASGGVMVGERVLVKLTTDSMGNTDVVTSSVRLGAAIRFSDGAAANDVEIGRILSVTTDGYMEILINRDALLDATALEDGASLSWTANDDTYARVEGFAGDVRADAVVSAVLHHPDRNSVVVDKNRANILEVGSRLSDLTSEQGDRVLIDNVDVGEVIAFDADKGLLSFAVLAEHLDKISLETSAGVVTQISIKSAADDTLREDAGETLADQSVIAATTKFNIAELRLASVRYDGAGTADANSDDIAGKFSLEGLAFGFDNGTGSGTLMALSTLDDFDVTSTKLFSGVSFLNRDRIVMGIESLPKTAVSWYQHRDYTFSDIATETHLFDITRNQLAVAADGGLAYRIEDGELTASTIKAEQRFVNYFGLDEVFMHGTNAQDIFTFDSTSALSYAYGHGGKDTFNVGSLISVRQAPSPDGQSGTVSVVETTAGTSTDTRLFGGTGNDYFQVYRNKGETWLNGDGGDDTFFVKATLGITNLGSGKGKNKVGYNRNAPLHIDGGSGFDTFILEGTEIGDQFIVFVDDDGVQQIKGAGVDIGSIDNVENIQINAIDGDDTIYVYGVNAETRLTINSGRGNDAIQIGGAAQVFDPASQSIVLNTNAAEAKVPTIVYEDVEEFVPGFTRVERIANADGTETVRQIVVQGYTRIKKIATVAMVSIASTSSTERKRFSPDAVRVGAQDDLTSFDNLVTLDGSAGADTVDVKLYGNTDGYRADGAMSVTSSRDIQIRALKAIYGQSYEPSDSELIPVDSPSNESFGWLTGFAGNSQGIVFDNVELVRIQLGDAANNFTVGGVDSDIDNLVISLGGGDDVLRVGEMSEIKTQIAMLDLNPASYDELNSTAVSDWFSNAAAATAGWTLSDLMMQAAYDSVVAEVEGLDVWLNALDLASLDATALAADQTIQLALNLMHLKSLDPAIRDWFNDFSDVLSRIDATSRDLMTQAVTDDIDLRSETLTTTALSAWFDGLDLTLFAANAGQLSRDWERANPRNAGVVGSLENILSRAILIGGTGNDQLAIYDNARADAVLAQVEILADIKPFQPEDRRIATAEEIAADPLQESIDFTHVRFLARDGGDGPDGSVAINSFEQSAIYLGADNDKVEVRGALQPMFIFAGGGDDDIFIGSTPNDALTSNLDALDTTITIDGGTGSTRMVISRGGDENPTGTVEVSEGAIVIRHFASDDKSLPPMVTAVAYQALVDATFNPAAAGYIAGSYIGELESGFDRGVTVYTGLGADKSVQIKSIRKEAPTRIYLGDGNDIASVLPSLNGENYGLRDPNQTDYALQPHDKLEVFGGDGNDRIDLSKALVNVRAFGGDDDDRLLGSTGFDILIGEGGDDWIEGYGAQLVDETAGDDTLWAQQLEVLVGDHLGRLMEVAGSGTNPIRSQLPSFIGKESHYFDERWMESGGAYLFDRSDDAGQFINLAEAVDADGVLLAPYRGGNPRGEWNSFATPTEMLGEGGNDLIFSGVALSSGFGLSQAAAATTLNGTNVIFAGAGQDRVFAGDANEAHAFGHVIVGDEARLRLRDEAGNRMFDLEDIAAPRAPYENPRGDDWLHFGAGMAHVLAGRGNDAVFAGLKPDGTDAAGQHDLRILTDMGLIRLLDDTTHVNFMKSAEDQTGGDDTAVVADGDVRLISGGGNDRIWIGYKASIAPVDPVGVNLDGSDIVDAADVKISLRDVLGELPQAFRVESTDLTIPDLLESGTFDATYATEAESWLWIPTVTAIDLSAATRRVQNISVLSDYGQIERMVYNDTHGANLLDPYTNQLAQIDMFVNGDKVIAEVAKSLAPSDNFDLVLSNLGLNTADRGWNRGDGGHDQITVGSARGVIIAGEGNDVITSGDNNAVISDSATTRDQTLAVLADTGEVHRFAETDERYASSEELPRLLRVSKSNDTTPVDTLGEMRESQTYRGGDDAVTVGLGNHVVMGGMGKDVIKVAENNTTNEDLRQIISGDGATMLFDPRLELGAPLELLYYETAERDSALVSDSVTTNDDVITVGAGDLLVTGGLGDDVMNLGKGRSIIAGDYLNLSTLKFEDVPRYSDGSDPRMVMSDLNQGVVGGHDTINSDAAKVLFIGGAGDDNATLQKGMLKTEEGHAFTIGGRGELVFDLGLVGGSGFSGDDVRLIPDMFGVTRLARATSFDEGLRMNHNTASTVTATVESGDTVNNSVDGKRYVYEGTSSLIVTDWSDTTQVDFTASDVWTTTSQPDDLAIKNRTGGDDTISLSFGRLLAFGGGGSDIVTARGTDNSGNKNSRNLGLFAGDMATAIFTPDADAFKVQTFGTGRDSDERIVLSGVLGVADWGLDSIKLGSGNMYAIGGEGADIIENGNGDAIVIGDMGDMMFSVSDDWKLVSVSNATSVSESTQTAVTDGNDLVTLGQGSKQIVMGGGGTDTTLAQGAGSAGVLQNDTFFAGDRATLVFDASAASLQMLSFVSSDDTDSYVSVGNDSFTTQDGDLRAILGHGADTLIKGDGLSIVLGDVGSMTANPTTFKLNEMIYDVSAVAVHDGIDAVTSGDGPHYMIMGGGADSVTVGNGEFIGLGDHGRISFDSDDVLRRVTTEVAEAERDNAIAYGGNDRFQAGQGSRHVFMGGIGNDTVLAQVDLNSDALPSGVANESYFAGDHAVLDFAEQTIAGELQTQMTIMRSVDWAAGPGTDSFTTGIGDVRAILGVGSDRLVQGDGLGYVVGDTGLLNQDNPNAILTEINSDLAGITLGDHGDDIWIAGDGEHVGVMGTGGDTVTLGDDDVQVLLDHGVISRDRVNGNLIVASDLSAIGSGDDVLQAGVGSGFVIGGGGNDEIKTGRTLVRGIGAGDGRHIILGDGGQIDFDPSLGDTMGLVKVQALQPDITGDDILAGGGGDDIVIGGPGSDYVYGEQGRDFIAGDFLLIDYIDGMESEVLTPFKYIFEGAGDTLSSGLDGDFVFGGTQSNRFSTAASVDVIFETFGRVSFVPSTSMYTINHLYNLGISGSLLDHRVADGQLENTGIHSSFKSAELGANRQVVETITHTHDGILTSETGSELGSFVSMENNSIFSFLTDAVRVQGIDTVYLDSAQQLVFSAQLLDPLNKILRKTVDIAEPEAVIQNAAEMRRDRLEPNKEVVAALPRAQFPSINTLQPENDIVQVGIEQNDDFLSLLETGGMVLSMASSGGYRKYGKARSVGSLEQRLRHWTGEGFALKGNDQYK